MATTPPPSSVAAPASFTTITAATPHTSALDTLSDGSILRVTIARWFTPADRTIDALVMNLRRKIEPDRSSPRFVETVFGRGYRFGGTRS